MAAPCSPTNRSRRADVEADRHRRQRTRRPRRRLVLTRTDDGRWSGRPMAGAARTATLPLRSRFSPLPSRSIRRIVVVTALASLALPLLARAAPGAGDGSRTPTVVGTAARTDVLRPRLGPRRRDVAVRRPRPGARRPARCGDPRPLLRGDDARVERSGDARPRPRPRRRSRPPPPSRRSLTAAAARGRSTAIAGTFPADARLTLRPDRAGLDDLDAPGRLGRRRRCSTRSVRSGGVTLRPGGAASDAPARLEGVDVRHVPRRAPDPV